jgi:predicted acetyltransferase
MPQMNLSDFHILRVDRVHDVTLAPLLKQYCSEMRAWMAPTSDAAAEGFTYPLEKVWNDDTHVYLAHVADIPAGFALVGPAQRYIGDPNARDMVEFFVATHLRRNGFGRAMAGYIWNQYPTQWLVRVYQANTPAIGFWAGAIANYSGGAYREEVGRISGNAWSYFTFAASDDRGRGP